MEDISVARKIFLILFLCFLIIAPTTGITYARYQDSPSVDIKEPLFALVNGFSIMQNYGDYMLKDGGWYDPYTRIYSVGGSNRVAEVSNFPRVYEDKEAHVYLMDTPFVVTESDLNYYDHDRNRFYKDTFNKLFKEGETAIHFKGDPLPGCFPKWIEYSSLQSVTYQGTAYFKLDKVPAPIKLNSMAKVEWMVVNPLSRAEVENVRYTVENEKYVNLPKGVISDNQILYFHYNRIIEGER